VKKILDGFRRHTIVVAGDFFLDQYLFIDPSLNEISLETGKIAYQIVGKRPQPGAAGTVCNNLHALGIGKLIALTVIGDDGEGYELRQALAQRSIDIENVLVTKERFTPTYTKPMLKTAEGEEEMNRQDCKNRKPLSPSLEREIQKRLESLAAQADAVIVADQVQERNCGIVTDALREFIADLAPRFPDTIFFADSRERIGEFKNIVIKPNRFEAIQAVEPDDKGDSSTSKAMQSAQTLALRSGKPVFLTLDKEGICPVFETVPAPIPCPPVTGPIDIVGAGDSVTAAIVSSLASKASLSQAAVIGNLVASITIRQLGTTGTASPAQVLEAWNANEALYKDV